VGCKSGFSLLINRLRGIVSAIILCAQLQCGTGEFPPMETELIDGDLAFRQHSGGHTTGPNWPTFLLFAGRYMPAR